MRLWPTQRYSPEAGGAAPASAPTEGAAPAAPEASKPPEPSPYDDLPEAERALAEQVDAALKSMSAAERLELARLARVGGLVLDVSARKGAAEAPDKPDGAAETPAAPEGRLDERLSKIEQELRSRQQAEQRARELAAFNRDLDAVLDADEQLRGDKALRDDLKEEFVGHYLKHRPQDHKGSFKRFLERQRARAELLAVSRKREYVERKQADAEATRGETRGGATPAREKKEYTAADFKSGRIAEDMKQELGVG